MSNGFVVLMGMGTVFIGLIIIVFLCKAMSAIVGSVEAKKAARNPAAPEQPAARPEALPAGAGAAIPNRGELAAAIAAAIAEESGTDAAGIRIVSIKRRG